MEITVHSGDENRGKRIRDFFETEAESLRARYEVIRTLLPSPNIDGSSHPGEEGRFIESLIRDFLNRHLPSELRAFSGFILSPSTKTGTSDYDRVNNFPDRHSRQLDIIIYDAGKYPFFERFEEFVIVPPEGVIGVISVKKKLRVEHLEREIEGLVDVASICASAELRMPYISVFSFEAEHEENIDKLGKIIFEKIEKVCKGKDFNFFINEINVLGHVSVFKVRPEHATAGHAKYVNVDCRGAGHISLQRILQSLMSVYYDEKRWHSISRPGFVSFQKRQFRDSGELGEIPTENIAPY